jgi:hypothetical protein
MLAIRSFELSTNEIMSSTRRACLPGARMHAFDQRVEALWVFRLNEPQRRLAHQFPVAQAQPPCGFHDGLLLSQSDCHDIPLFRHGHSVSR